MRPLVTRGDVTIEDCRFTSQFPRSLLLASNRSVVTRSVFGPATTQPFTEAISLDGELATVVGNTFIDIQYGYQVLDIQCSLPDSVLVQDNQFISCNGLTVGLMAAGCIGIPFEPDDAILGPLISGNDFINNTGHVNSDDIRPQISAPSRIENNRFLGSGKRTSFHRREWIAVAIHSSLIA